jgi:hypothetical protein
VFHAGELQVSREWWFDENDDHRPIELKNSDRPIPHGAIHVIERQAYDDLGNALMETLRKVTDRTKRMIFWRTRARKAKEVLEHILKMGHLMGSSEAWAREVVSEFDQSEGD